MGRILVAGGTGHLGERVVRRLLGLGHGVLVLTRDPRGPVARSLSAAGAGVREGDCTRRWMLWEALEECGTFVSCAHMRHAEACVQACRTVGVSRLIVLSSTRRFTRFPSKVSEEVIAGESAVAVSTLDWTILRPTMIFGGQRDQNMTRLMDWFRRHHWSPLFGRGTNLVQPVFVEDVVDAVIAALDIEDSIGQAFNIAGADPLAFHKMLREVAKAVGVADPSLVRVPGNVATMAVRMFGPMVRQFGLDEDVLRRFSEDKHVNIEAAWQVLRFRPLAFPQAIRLKAEGKAEVEAIYQMPEPARR